MVGGGGGGGGSGTSVTGGDGADGTASTFGTSLLTAPRGLGGAKSGSSIGGSSGGAATVNSPARLVYSYEGERASAGFPGGISYMPGGNGGSSYFGGAGVGIFNATAGPARANSGSGGGGGGTGADDGPGGAGGGGAGTYLRAIIPAGSVATSYGYTVGTGGAGGTAGTSGFAGGAGGDGIIIITEHYNTDNMPLYKGSVEGSTVVKNEGSAGITTVEAGQANVVVTGITNVAAVSTPTTCRYSRIGNFVSAFCFVEVNCTTAGGTLTVYDVALPITSNFTSTGQASGVQTTLEAGFLPGQIASNATDDRVRVSFPCGETGLIGRRINFQYQVLQ